MTTTTTPKVRCGFRGPSRYAGRCDETAVQAIIVQPFTRDGDTHYAGRCKRHAGVEKRRKYGAPTLVDLTPDVLASIEADRVANEKANQERQAERAAVHAKQVEAHRQRLYREAAEPVVWGRQDEPGDLDWEATRTARETDPEAFVREPSIPQWVGTAAGMYNELRVKVVAAPNYPTRLDVRTSSELTIAQARALRDMLSEALNLVEEEV